MMNLPRSSVHLNLEVTRFDLRVGCLCQDLFLKVAGSSTFDTVQILVHPPSLLGIAGRQGLGNSLIGTVDGHIDYGILTNIP
jgi:hypothetical protein